METYNLSDIRIVKSKIWTNANFVCFTVKYQGAGYDITAWFNAEKYFGFSVALKTSMNNTIPSFTLADTNKTSKFLIQYFKDSIEPEYPLDKLYPFIEFIKEKEIQITR